MIAAVSPASGLIARFERAAEAAREAESAYRRMAAERIAVLEHERSTAFRRLNLLRSAIKAIVEAEDPEKAAARARFVIAGALGWDEPGPRQTLVLDRLTPVIEALEAILKAGENSETTGAEAALRTFETWYREEIGGDFYALFDRYMPETPRVDF